MDARGDRGRRDVKASDYIDPADIRPRGGIFLPEAFGKSELETAAVLLVYYFQEPGVWAPFRPDEWSMWLKNKALARDNRHIDTLMSNPFLGAQFAVGFWGLVHKGFIVPLSPLREGEDVADQFVHVTEEFILRCYLSSSGLKPTLMKFFRLMAACKEGATA